MGALFWDRRRPRLPMLQLAILSGDEGRRGRLHPLQLAILSGDECRRGRLRSQKSAPDT